MTLTGADRAAKLQRAAYRRARTVAALGTRREAFAATLLIVALTATVTPLRTTLEAHLTRPGPARIETHNGIGLREGRSIENVTAPTTTPDADPDAAPVSRSIAATRTQHRPGPAPQTPTAPPAPPTPTSAPPGGHPSTRTGELTDWGDPNTPIVPGPGTTGPTGPTTPPPAPPPVTEPPTTTPPPATGPPPVHIVDPPPTTSPPPDGFEDWGDPNTPIVPGPIGGN